MAETSSLDTPSIDAYVSSLIASGAVEEGAFYKWTTPSGEEYYGPNPRRQRTTTPRTQRTPIDPLPDIEESDISGVEEIISQIEALEEPSAFGGREGEAPPNEPHGYVIDGEYMLNEGTSAMSIRNDLMMGGANLKIKNVLDFLSLKNEKDSDAVATIKSLVSTALSPVKAAVGFMVGRDPGQKAAQLGMVIDIGPEGAKMAAKAIAGLPTDNLNALMDAFIAARDTEDDSKKRADIDRVITLLEADLGSIARKDAEDTEAKGVRLSDFDQAINTLEMGDMLIDTDEVTGVVYNEDGEVTGVVGNMAGGGQFTSFKAMTDHMTGKTKATPISEISNKLDSRQRTYYKAPVARARPVDRQLQRAPYLLDKPDPEDYDYPGGGVHDEDEPGDIDYPGAGSPVGQFPSETGRGPSLDPSSPTGRYTSTSAPTDEKVEAAQKTAEKAIAEVPAHVSPIPEGDETGAGEGASEDWGASIGDYWHEGGLINKTSKWMGGEDSTDHAYKPLADARPVLDEGGMVKKPSYQAGGKVKPQQSPYAAFQNKANQQTKQMLQPKQPPGQRPQPMAGQPRQPSAKGAPQAGDNVDITAKKGEFIIPVDVVKIKGTEFFEKAISGARKTHFEATGRRNAQKKQRSAKTISRFDPNAPKSRRNPMGLPKIAGATPTPGTPPVRPKVKRPVPGQRPTSPVSQQPGNMGSQQRQPVLS